MGDLHAFVMDTLEAPSVELAEHRLSCGYLFMDSPNQVEELKKMVRIIIQSECDSLLAAIYPICPHKLAPKPRSWGNEGRLTNLYLVRCLHSSLKGTDFRSMIGFHQGRRMIYLDEHHQEAEADRQRLLVMFGDALTVFTTSQQRVCFSL